MKIEGLARNVGTHAAAVVIADQPLTEYVPLCRVQGKDEIITQWAMGDVEARRPAEDGFSRPAQLDDPLQGRRSDRADDRASEVDPYKFPLDDHETFALLAAARRRASSSSKAAAFAICCRR